MTLDLKDLAPLLPVENLKRLKSMGYDSVRIEEVSKYKNTIEECIVF